MMLAQWPDIKAKLLQTLTDSPLERRLLYAAVLGVTDDLVIDDTKWSTLVSERYGDRSQWMDHLILSQVSFAWPDVHLIVHKPFRRPVDVHAQVKPERIVRILLRSSHFFS